MLQISIFPFVLVTKPLNRTIGHKYFFLSNFSHFESVYYATNTIFVTITISHVLYCVFQFVTVTQKQMHATPYHQTMYSITTLATMLH